MSKILIECSLNWFASFHIWQSNLYASSHPWTNINLNYKNGLESKSSVKIGNPWNISKELQSFFLCFWVKKEPQGWEHFLRHELLTWNITRHLVHWCYQASPGYQNTPLKENSIQHALHDSRFFLHKGWIASSWLATAQQRTREKDI